WRARVWCVRRLRGVICASSEPAGATPPALKTLPQLLYDQYDFEETAVRLGAHLLHTQYFKTLESVTAGRGAVGVVQTLLPLHPHSRRSHPTHPLPIPFLAEVRKRLADLGIDHYYPWEDEVKYSTIRNEQIMHWANKKVNDPTDSSPRPSVTAQKPEAGGSTPTYYPWEDHTKFTRQHDEQLLHWVNKRPEDWNGWWVGNPRGCVVYGWGHNHRGQLGGVDGAKVRGPSACHNLALLNPVQLVGGEQTLFAVTPDGKVYATGYGAGGRLGIGGIDSVSQPTLLSSIQHVFITKVACNSGGKHCLALSSDGDVYSWGEGDDGKLGHGNRVSYDRPRLIPSLSGMEVVQIACGGAHSACLTARGRIYTWGKGRYGRLGHGDSEDQLVPKMVEYLASHRVIDVACGSGDAQTLCITDDDNVWSWGDGDYGKLGTVINRNVKGEKVERRGGSEGCKQPMKIECLKGLRVIKVECGSQFSVALCQCGSVYTWGKGDYHRLGHGSYEHVRRPMRVTGMQGKMIVSIATGSLHCVACTDTGEVYTWGDNDEGQLGDGTTLAAQRPRRAIASVGPKSLFTLAFLPAVSRRSEKAACTRRERVEHAAISSRLFTAAWTLTLATGKRVTRVACGSAHTVALCVEAPRAPRPPPPPPLECHLLRDMPPQLVCNRLVLLHQFSELVCPNLTMLILEGNLDQLRSLMFYSVKEAAFRKAVMATMVRERQHGPVVELSRVAARRARRGGAGLAGPAGMRSVFGQMVARLPALTQDALALPHRVWKVKFVGAPLSPAPWAVAPLRPTVTPLLH
ncbi:hypothetical protein MSG28_002052, partial [Choristoneura fumiferana]